MRSSEQMERQVPDKKLFVSADTTVPLYKRDIFVTGASPPPTVTLPNVSEAEGRRFTVTALTVPATTDARVVVDYTNGTGSGLTTSIATTGVDVEFESNGLEYILTR